MKNHVTLIDQFGSDRMIVNGIDRVMKTRMTFEVLNVLDRAGREIVDDVNFVATLDVSITQMRSDKPRAASYQYSQTHSFCHQKAIRTLKQSDYVPFVPFCVLTLHTDF